MASASVSHTVEYGGGGVMLLSGSAGPRRRAMMTRRSSDQSSSDLLRPPQTSRRKPHLGRQEVPHKKPVRTSLDAQGDDLTMLSERLFYMCEKILR